MIKSAGSFNVLDGAPYRPLPLCCLAVQRYHKKELPSRQLLFTHSFYKNIFLIFSKSFRSLMEYRSAIDWSQYM